MKKPYIEIKFNTIQHIFITEVIKTIGLEGMYTSTS